MIIKKLINKFKDYREFERVRKTWILTLVYSNLYTGSPKSNDTKTFDLLNIERTPTGLKAVSLVPYGLSVKQLEEHKDKLQDALNSKIIIEKDAYKPKIHIEIINKAPVFKYAKFKTKENEMFLGYTLTGKPFFSDLDIDSNYLVAGMRGTGKSVYLITILTAFLSTHADVELHLIQIMKAELMLFNSSKFTKSVSTTIQDALLVLRYALKEVNRRAKLFSEAGKGIDSMSKYNKVTKGKKLSRMLIFVDEISAFMDVEKDSKDYKDSQEVSNLFQAIAKFGRSTGICIVAGTQKGTVENLSSNLKSQMCRLVFKVQSNSDSVNLINSSDATKLAKRELICTVDGIHKLIAPTIDQSYSCLIETLPEIGEEPSQEVLKQQQDFMSSLRPKEPLLKVIKKPEVRTEDKTQAKEVKPITEHSDALQEVSTATESNIKLTKRDKEILKFTENYGAFTVNQCCSMFFKGNTSKNACRRRLNELVDAGILDVAQVGNKVNKQYFLKGGKGKTEHDLYVLDCYAKFLEVGCKVTEFKLVPRLLGGKVVPDAYFKLKYKNKTHNVFVEVDLTHITKQEKINLYEEYKSKNKLDFCILILKKDKLLIESNQIDIYKTDFKLTDISNFLENF